MAEKKVAVSVTNSSKKELIQLVKQLTIEAAGGLGADFADRVQELIRAGERLQQPHRDDFMLGLCGRRRNDRAIPWRIPDASPRINIDVHSAILIIENLDAVIDILLDGTVPPALDRLLAAKAQVTENKEWILGGLRLLS